MLRLRELKASFLVSLLASTGYRHPDSHSGIWLELCSLHTQTGGFQKM